MILLLPPSYGEKENRTKNGSVEIFRWQRFADGSARVGRPDTKRHGRRVYVLYYNDINNDTVVLIIIPVQTMYYYYIIAQGTRAGIPILLFNIMPYTDA